MITETENKILGFIRTNKQARAHDLGRIFGISQVAVHKQLKKLLWKGQIKKMGRPPLVFYVPAPKTVVIPQDVPAKIRNKIDENYLYISPVGELLYGFAGFLLWAKAIKEEARLDKLAVEYVATLNKFKTHQTADGWIDATTKLKNTFGEVVVDRLLYGDFYTYPKFGKTKLGQLVLYAKQSQNRELTDELATMIKPIIEKIIKKFAIDALAFIPPTVPRQFQFIKEFEKVLSLKIPSIDLAKVVAGDVVVAQKTLARLEERIENARDTIFLKGDVGSYSRLLLLDDAAGSGSTFNETAKKLKSALIGKNSIMAFAIVGSFKGFDVIREV